MKTPDMAAEYRSRGTDLVLFLHGLGCAKESFEGAWKTSILRDYSLLVPDLLGFGASAKPERFSYSVEDQAEVVMAEVGKYPHDRVHMVVHSAGGAPGLLVAEMLEDKLGVFINAEGSLNRGGAASARTAAVSFEIFEKEIFNKIKAGLVTHPEPGYRLWADWMRKADPVACYKTSVSLLEWIENGKLVEKFNALKAKKVYIFGEKSAQRLAPVFEAIPDIAKIEIPNAEHFMMIDNPEAFYSAVANLLK